MSACGCPSRESTRPRFGFLTKSEVSRLAACRIHRLERVLIRWHEARALVSAQDAERFIEIAREAEWCLRDVCFHDALLPIPNVPPAHTPAPKPRRRAEWEDDPMLGHSDADPGL